MTNLSRVSVLNQQTGGGGGGIAYVDVGTYNANDDLCTIDPTYSTGDVLLIFGTQRNAGTLTQPTITGWDARGQGRRGGSGNDITGGAWSRVSTGSENSTETVYTAIGRHVCTSWSGVGSVGATDDTNWGYTQNGTGDASSALSYLGTLPTVNTGDMLVSFCTDLNGFTSTPTAPSGMTLAHYDNAGLDQELAIAYQQIDSAPSAQSWGNISTGKVVFGCVLLKA